MTEIWRTPARSSRDRHAAEAHISVISDGVTGWATYGTVPYVAQGEPAQGEPAQAVKALVRASGELPARRQENIGRAAHHDQRGRRLGPGDSALGW
ncbi:hypothetical protein [Salinibacterium sp.]|uniref:hypothetical protein n=1 Tax=Salinibacterium sp. TaxID=1915057 RepID=UPI00286BF1CF|nr:hypothetical protein [Salinibacterium sp.]